MTQWKFHLHGILPPHIGALKEQAARRLNVLNTFTADIQRYAFLRDLQDTNETLFYSVSTDLASRKNVAARVYADGR
jgi:hypothetical protein